MMEEIGGLLDRIVGIVRPRRLVSMIDDLMVIDVHERSV